MAQIKPLRAPWGTSAGSFGGDRHTTLALTAAGQPSISPPRGRRPQPGARPGGLPCRPGLLRAPRAPEAPPGGTQEPPAEALCRGGAPGSPCRPLLSLRNPETSPSGRPRMCMGPRQHQAPGSCHWLRPRGHRTPGGRCPHGSLRPQGSPPAPGAPSTQGRPQGGEPSVLGSEGCGRVPWSRGPCGPLLCLAPGSRTPNAPASAFTPTVSAGLVLKATRFLLPFSRTSRWGNS